jgi:hypothetical protein
MFNEILEVWDMMIHCGKLLMNNYWLRKSLSRSDKIDRL